MLPCYVPLTKLLLPTVSHPTKTATVLLIQDGHHSHISLEYQKNQWQQCHHSMPSLNTTHLLQPFDLAVFPPVKKAWKTEGASFFKTCFLEYEMKPAPQNPPMQWFGFKEASHSLPIKLLADVLSPRLKLKLWMWTMMRPKSQILLAPAVDMKLLPLHSNHQKLDCRILCRNSWSQEKSSSSGKEK